MLDFGILYSSRIINYASETIALALAIPSEVTLFSLSVRFAMDLSNFQQEPQNPPVSVGGNVSVCKRTEILKRWMVI